jgi:hypothetical protein
MKKQARRGFGCCADHPYRAMPGSDMDLTANAQIGGYRTRALSCGGHSA